MKNVNATKFRLSIKVWALIFSTFLLAANSPVLAQHDMSNMSGMSKPKAKSKAKATTRKKRKLVRKKQTAKKHNMGNMPGMKMPGMNMPMMHRRKVASRSARAGCLHAPPVSIGEPVSYAFTSPAGFNSHRFRSLNFRFYLPLVKT